MFVAARMFLPHICVCVSDACLLWFIFCFAHFERVRDLFFTFYSVFVFVFVSLCFSLFLHISNGVNFRPDVSPVSVGAPAP